MKSQFLQKLSNILIPDKETDYIDLYNLQNITGWPMFTIVNHDSENNGYFVAQINWDKGAPYYRLVACEAKSVTFFEAIPIPIGASQGSIYVTSRETSSIQVKNIILEVN